MDVIESREGWMFDAVGHRMFENPAQAIIAVHEATVIGGAIAMFLTQLVVWVNITSVGCNMYMRGYTEGFHDGTDDDDDDDEDDYDIFVCGCGCEDMEEIPWAPEPRDTLQEIEVPLEPTDIEEVYETDPEGTK